MVNRTISLPRDLDAQLRKAATAAGLTPEEEAARVLAAWLAALSWQAQDTLVVLDLCEARPDQAIGLQQLVETWLEAKPRLPLDALYAGLDDLHARGLIAAFPRAAKVVQITEIGYWRLQQERRSGAAQPS